MGNKPVKIGVKLDQTSFEAGSILKGCVYLSVTGQEGRRAQGVHLLLVGQEVSTVAHDAKHRRNSSHESYTEIERSTTSLVHLDVPLTQFESGTVEQGQYEFPFEWDLPGDLPGTMRCQRGDSHCEVSYQLTAYLYSGRRNAWGGSLSPDASSVVNVCVLAQPNAAYEKGAIFMEPEEFPVKQCCLCSQGHIALGWDADTAVASPRMAVQVGIVGSNASLVEVKHVRVRWMEVISWNARGYAKQAERILDESLIPVSLQREWRALDRLGHGHSQGVFSQQHQGPYSSLHNSNNNGTSSRLLTSLNIPPDARDTYQGRLIQVRHSLVVQAITSGGCCVTSPESSALVTIQRQPPISDDTTTATAVEEYESMSASATIVEPSAPLEDDETHVFVEANVLPEDWSAQTADVVTLTVPSAHLLGEEHASAVSVMPTAPSSSLDGDDTIEQLQESLSMATDPIQLIEEHWLCHPTICTLLQNATPNQYVSLLQANMTANAGKTPQVARSLAIVMDSNFTCNHVLASLWALPQYVRMQVLQQVAPLASDLDKNQHWIEQQLDDNELLHFRAALR